VPTHPFLRFVRTAFGVLAATVPLVACGASSATPDAQPPAPVAPGPAAVDRPARGTAPDAASAPHAVSLVVDFGPLPDGSGHAVVDTTWTVDAHGTRRLVIDTPAGIAEQHVMTDDEHWWWLSPEVRATIADAEWIHFDLRAIEEVDGELPDIVAAAREVVRQPGDVGVGHVVAGHEVLAVGVVDDDEVHLTLAGIRRHVVHRRRALPAGTTIELPAGAVDVGDLPGVLRW
jgi:hypothetical protein